MQKIKLFGIVTLGIAAGLSLISVQVAYSGSFGQWRPHCSADVCGPGHDGVAAGDLHDNCQLQGGGGVGGNLHYHDSNGNHIHDHDGTENVGCFNSFK